MKYRNLIITVAVIAVSAMLSMAVGFAILNMTDLPETGDRESLPAETEAGKTALPSSQASSSSEETDPVSGSDGKPFDMDDSLVVLTDEEISSIRQNYDGTLKTYYTKTEMNENNRPVEASYFQAIFRQNIGNGVKVMNTDGKRITLSFVLTAEYDGNTDYLLNYLSAKEAKAIFFVSFSYALNNPDIILRILNDGHTLGSLGYSLPTSGFASLSLEEQAEDLQKMHEYIFETYGYSMTEFFYGNRVYSYQSMALLIGMGYEVCFYTVDYADQQRDQVIDASVFLSELLSRSHDGAIYSLHTSNTASLIVVPSLIDKLRENGYEIGLFD